MADTPFPFVPENFCDRVGVRQGIQGVRSLGAFRDKLAWQQTECAPVSHSAVGNAEGRGNFRGRAQAAGAHLLGARRHSVRVQNPPYTSSRVGSALIRRVALSVEFCGDLLAIAVGGEPGDEFDELGMDLLELGGTARQRNLDLAQGTAMEPQLHPAVVR